MESWKQPMRPMDSWGQGFSDSPLINLSAVLSTNTCRHLCHWICPWQARWFLGQQFCCFPRPGCCPFSPMALSIQDFHSGLQSFQQWLPVLMSAPHAQQCWRYQCNTPSAWEAYHYQLRRCRSSGNFNQQRHFHIQRDKDIINSLKWAPEEMSCSSWDSFFLHPVWNKLFHEVQWCPCWSPTVNVLVFSHRCTQKVKFLWRIFFSMRNMLFISLTSLEGTLHDGHLEMLYQDTAGCWCLKMPVCLMGQCLFPPMILICFHLLLRAFLTCPAVAFHAVQQQLMGT